MIRGSRPISCFNATVASVNAFVPWQVLYQQNRDSPVAVCLLPWSAGFAWIGWWKDSGDPNHVPYMTSILVEAWFIIVFALL